MKMIVKKSGGGEVRFSEGMLARAESNIGFF